MAIAQRKRKIFWSISHLSVTPSDESQTARENGVKEVVFGGINGTNPLAKPLMERETCADNFFSLHTRKSIFDMRAKKISEKHFAKDTSLESIIFPPIRQLEFAVAWQLSVKQVQLVPNRFTGRTLQVRVRLLGRVEDKRVKISSSPKHQHHLGLDEYDPEGTAFITYPLNADNDFTWDSLALQYLGDIVAGDWGLDGPRMVVRERA